MILRALTPALVALAVLVLATVLVRSQSGTLVTLLGAGGGVADVTDNALDVEIIP